MPHFPSPPASPRLPYLCQEPGRRLPNRRAILVFFWAEAIMLETGCRCRQGGTDRILHKSVSWSLSSE
jgi:hypothetical protein